MRFLLFAFVLLSVSLLALGADEPSAISKLGEKLIANSEDQSAWVEISELIKSSDRFQRVASAAQLGWIVECLDTENQKRFSEKALPLLVAALDDQDNGVVRAASESLVQFGPAAGRVRSELGEILNLYRRDDASYFLVRAIAGTGDLDQLSEQKIREAINARTLSDNSPPEELLKECIVALCVKKAFRDETMKVLRKAFDGEKNPALKSALATTILQVDAANAEMLAYQESVIEQADSKLVENLLWDYRKILIYGAPLSSGNVILLKECLNHGDPEVRGLANSVTERLSRSRE